MDKKADAKMNGAKIKADGINKKPTTNSNKNM
jgi:hypothetical protein